MVGSLVTLFVALLAGRSVSERLKEYAPGIVGNSRSRMSSRSRVSMPGIFVFLVSRYYVLTNEDLTCATCSRRDLRDVCSRRRSRCCRSTSATPRPQPGLRAFGAPAILLVWLYVMANVIVFGAELNWWRPRRRRAANWSTS